MADRTGRAVGGSSAGGLASMLAATAFFVAMTAFVKLLREDGMSTAEVMFWRMAPGLPWVWVELRRRQVPLAPRGLRPVVLRCLFGLCAMATNFYAVRVLTLVQQNVLHLLQPVFVALLAPLLLRERLRGFALAALVLAGGGALAVLEPGHAVREVPVGPALAGLSTALFSALAHIAVRRATARDAAELVVFHFTLAVSAVSLAVGLAEGGIVSLPAGLSTGEAAWKIAGMASFGLAGQLSMTRAYDRAQAPAVAVVAYAAIPLSLTLDVLLWGARGSAATLAGAACMVVAGGLLLLDQRRSASRLPPDLQQHVATAGEREHVALPQRAPGIDRQ